ncbi:DNA-binding transcriptional response regulator, NtrC family, contains REC, AAA-type ATPase, and a Fis-type DNA-binding domains [Bacteroidales bacterium WCE2004]|nr:DNA-binding transcriptional response regulator, NtrC family, contains REC, AAA-type ATPase, and a Fis-type DNA-binding domains [Bacteroidales bacterium WCE2004]
MATKKGKILVVDDNAGIRKALEILLPMHFAEVKTIPSPATLVSTLEQFRPDVILLDMNFNTSINTGNEGLYWAGEIKKMAPDVEVVLFTAYADIQLAVEGMKRGAFDFVVKPWENDKLVEVLLAARDKARKAMGRDAKASEARPAEAGAMFWGDSPAMAAIRKTLDKIAPTDATVLITGENGTGKDVLAREIHARSLRNGKAMVAVDAGAITETLFESELFGHVKGAFTDAHTDHEGKFEQADGGTLFLDEIGNIPLHLQAKLLRAIQNRSIVRVGGTEARPVNIRLICATNMDLAALVREGRFREDLFYRINTVHIALPSLRERRDDIVPLAERFLLRFAEKYHRPLTGISHEAAELLKAQRWNGNIRELQNCIEKAVILSEGRELSVKDLAIDTHAAPEAAPAGAAAYGAPAGLSRNPAEEERLVREAMERAMGNISAAAKILGVSRPTLYAKLKKYGL